MNSSPRRHCVLLVLALTTAPILAHGALPPASVTAAKQTIASLLAQQGKPRPAIVYLPNQLVPPLVGEIDPGLPHQTQRALPGQVTHALPGQVVRALPGQIVPALPGQIVRPLPGQIVQ